MLEDYLSLENLREMVTSEEEFLRLIQQINTEIKAENFLHGECPPKPLLNENYLLMRYRQLKEKERKEQFKREHECKYCLYYEKPRRCFETRNCPLDKGWNPDYGSQRKSRCSKDEKGDCPYANDAGTCFGFCYKEILKEILTKKTEKES